MEKQEAAQRAEVEHQMTRREVEVLHAAEKRNRASVSTPIQRAAAPPSQPQIDALTKTCQALEEERDDAEHQLQRAKKAIEMEKDRAELLMEENLLLKKRIRENREHYTRFKSQSPIYSTPRDVYATPIRRAVPRYPGSTSAGTSDALNVLVSAASEYHNNGDSVTVPTTPSRARANKVKQGHVRGAQSLSSLHATPARSRPATSDGFLDPRQPFSGPGSQLVNESSERERHDRDSTISVSDDEIEDIPHSQASSLAAEMLRRNPTGERVFQGAERSSNLLQSKILGPVKKPGIERSKGRKRGGSWSESEMKEKKARMNDSIGLGIESWSRA